MGRSTNYVAAGGRPVPCLWPGSTVVCLATGPSLTAEDVERCRGQHVVAVNDAVRLAPFADVLYSSDLRWWRHYHGWPAFGGLKFSIEQRPGEGTRPFRDWPDVTVLRNTGEAGLEVARDGLRTGRNSGAAAINLAVHLGAARIVLLGYDCGDQGSRSHFFGSHPAALLSRSPYHTFRRRFAQLVEPLRARGVAVVNCSAQTQLGCFPRRPFADEAAAW